MSAANDMELFGVSFDEKVKLIEDTEIAKRFVQESKEVQKIWLEKAKEKSHGQK